MGNMWRNREFRRHIGSMLLAGILLLPLCFYLEPMAGAVASLLFLAALAISWGYTARRYRDISRLCTQLAKIAGGNYRVDIAGYEEGELGILSSEIRKLTSTLSHQAQSLQRDKSFLADSLADISHQLKTPLTSMSMLADLLETPGLPEEKRGEFLAGMRTSLDRMGWLISSLLKLSRLDAGAVQFQVQEAPLTGIVEKALAPLGIPMEIKGQRLVTDLEEDILLETDSHWLAEAVGNIVKNCVEHTGECGSIYLSGRRNALYTEIRIWDNGPGFPPGELPHIFERFYRGRHASADSVGIGLALSKSILQNLGGTITAENASEGGAQFTVKLYGKTVV